VAACVINQVHQPPFAALDAWPTARAALAEHDHPAWREAVRLTDHWVSHAQRQARAIRRLGVEMAVPTVQLPYRFRRKLEQQDLDALADSFCHPGTR
jgi:hypothetical protein